jgi:hypothetical protein
VQGIPPGRPSSNGTKRVGNLPFSDYFFMGPIEHGANRISTPQAEKETESKKEDMLIFI